MMKVFDLIALRLLFPAMTMITTTFEETVNRETKMPKTEVKVLKENNVKG